jgi:hypothetical protein
MFNLHSNHEVHDHVQPASAPMSMSLSKIDVEVENVMATANSPVQTGGVWKVLLHILELT